MVFSSFQFIFLFVPITLMGYYLLAKRGELDWVMGWLFAASLFFYAYWNPPYVALILFSIIFNHQWAKILHRGKRMLVYGIAINLLLLVYFKYTGFIAKEILGYHKLLNDIILPIGISFFTFQQVAFLVDRYRGHFAQPTFLSYALFVSFFPQLIAGPILRHDEIIPYFKHAHLIDRNLKRWVQNLAVGSSIFAIGLVKKVFIADGVSIFVAPVFFAAEMELVYPLTFFKAWGAALAYAFQIYFDFSGYSDMAIGLCRIFGMRIPTNFDSPYKATSMIDFWHRWHITLSRFLRDYLYIPLGGNRLGRLRRYGNLLLVMALGGFWHGANWTFLIWGLIHGLLLFVNHLFREITGRGDVRGGGHPLGIWLGRMVTFFCVVVAWVFFRADSLTGATHMLQAMFGVNGFGLTFREGWLLDLLLSPFLSLMTPGVSLFQTKNQALVLLLCLLLVWFSPNTCDIFAKYRPALRPRGMESVAPRWLTWRLGVPHGIAIGILWFIALLGLTVSTNEFIYYQF